MAIDQQDLIRIERMLLQNRYRLANAHDAGDAFDEAARNVAREIAAELLLDVRPVAPDLRPVRPRVPVDTSHAVIGDAASTPLDGDWQGRAYAASTTMLGVDKDVLGTLARLYRTGDLWTLSCLGSGMPAPERSPHYCAVCGRRVNSSFVDGGDTLILAVHPPDQMSVVIAAQPELALLLGRVIRGQDARDKDLSTDERAALERVADYLDPDGKGWRTIKVTWSPVAVQDALDTLLEYRPGSKSIPPHLQAIDIAIDALRAVLAGA